MATKDNNCTCSNCGTEFYKKPSHIYKTNFCNKNCFNAYQVGKSSRAYPDLTGQQFSKLTVLELAESANGQRQWKCLCECGGFIKATTDDLHGGRKKSCGCLRGESHGMTATVEYKAWRHMLGRCLNKDNKSYKDYGDRGIKVCDRWLHSFACFIADMGLRPSPKSTLERIDNEKGYSPDNCRWATSKEQNRNKRSTHLITFNGERLCLSDWAIRLGIHSTSLRYRIRNWTLEQALTIPASENYWHQKASQPKPRPRI